MTNIRWRELEPRDAQDNCVAIGTWQGHAFANLRLLDGSWLSVHLDEHGAVTEIAKSPSGKLVHKELLAYKRRLEAAEGAEAGRAGTRPVAAMPPGEAAAPFGMPSFRCPRCNAVQNVPAGDPSFQCWQCKLLVRIPKGD